MESNLNSDFYSIISLYEKLDNYDGNSKDEEFQKQLTGLICKVDSLLNKTNKVPLFSLNETLDDLTAESIKFLILPALLGSLHNRKVENRIDALKKSIILYQEFLSLCEAYEISLKIEDLLTLNPSYDSMPPNVKAQALSRDKKIAEYKEKQRLKTEIENKFEYIKTNPDIEEEIKRNFFIDLVKMWIMNANNDLPNIKMEIDFIQNRPVHEENLKKVREKTEKIAPVKPYVITKEMAQSKVFGLGYPSSPLGGIPKIPENPRQNLTVTRVDPSDTQEQNNEKRKSEDDKLEDIMDSEAAEKDRNEKIRMDEYKDEHRRGDGNRMHRL